MQHSLYGDAADSAVRLLRAMYEAQQAFVRGRSTPQAIFDNLLNILLSITGSEYGFIGKVLQTPDSAPFLKIYSMTNIAWSEETQALYARHKADGMEFRELASLYGYVLTMQQAYISNAPAADPHKHGIPQGHPALTSFLGIPILNNELLGMIGIANRPDGYTEDMISFLEPLVSTCAVIIEALNEREERAKVTEQVFAGERRFQAIADSITDIFCTYDRNLRFVYGNKAAQEFIGLTIAEVYGKHLFDIFPPGEVTLYAERVFLQALDTLQAQHYITEYKWNNKHYVFDVSVYPSNEGISVIAQNITERRRVEAERERALDFLDKTGTVAKVSGWEYDIEKNEVRFTKSTYHIYEIPDGATFTIESALSFVHSDDYPRVRAAFDALLRDGTPYNVQARFTTAAGNERFVRAIGQREERDGVPVRIMGTLQDVTEQALLREQIEQQLADLTHSHEELQVRQQFLDAVLTTAPATLYIHDLRSDTIHILNGLNVNVGRSKEYLEGHQFREMVLAWFDEESLQAWEERQTNLIADRTNRVFSLQARYSPSDGKWIWGLDHAVVLTRSADGTPQQILCASTDITDLKRAEEQIQALNANLEEQVQQRTEELTLLNKEKGELLSIAAHDLKSPLQGISLAAGLAQQYFRQGNMTKVLEILHSIEHASQSAGETLATFLSAAAIESGVVRLKIDEVSSVLVQDIITAYQVRAEAKELQLSCSIPQTPLYFKADRIALREVLENLLSNAVKFSPKGKNIFVRIEKYSLGNISHSSDDNNIMAPITNDYIRINIQDEGPGISEEDKKRLFGKFVRLTARPTAGEYSTGLGLSIVKKMVEAMNGKVWCESELGKGATFIIILPAT